MRDPRDISEGDAEDVMERRRWWQEHGEPEPRDPWRPGGRFWPPTLDVLREEGP